MPYDRELADRVRDALSELGAGIGLSEKAMFGGLAFLIGGRMAVAVSGSGGLLVRCDPAQASLLVGTPHVDRMVMRGREMAGWLRVGGPALTDDAALHDWLTRGMAAAAADA